MKRLVTLVIGMMLVGSLGMAADAENTATTKTDTTHNPLTGNDTKTVKTKKKVKTAKGTSEVEVTDKTKTNKDGKVIEQHTDVDADAAVKH